jgi:aryl-alcohol dehydrogenase-like predicted oxidoreductase
MFVEEPPMLTRRDYLKMNLAAGAALAINPAWALARGDQPLPLITRPIPSTGERIPVIGLGTNQYSVETPEEYAQLQEVLEAMADQGGTVIDTARVYGRAEEVIGELLRRMQDRDRWFISTKTPIGGELAAADVELQTSFDQLGVDVVDLMLIHNMHGLEALMPAFIRWKEAGRIRYIGMSTHTDTQYADQMAAMRRYPLDFIQVDYSIANRNAADEIIPLAQERGMAVMVNVPFGGRRGAAETFARVSGQELPGWAAEFDAHSWAQVFLKYVVSHPGVTVAIPGTIRARHVIDNQGAGRGRLPDADARREIERFWDSLG